MQMVRSKFGVNNMNPGWRWQCNDVNLSGIVLVIYQTEHRLNVRAFWTIVADHACAYLYGQSTHFPWLEISSTSQMLVDMQVAAKSVSLTSQKNNLLSS